MSIVVYWLCLIGVIPTSAAVELTFTLDPAASEVSVTGYIVPIEAQTMPQGAGSDVTRFGGTLVVDVDDPLAPASIEFLGGSAAAENSGDWLPQAGGGTPGGVFRGDADPGIAQPANYGLEAQAPIVGQLWIAFRDLVLSPTSASLAVEDGMFVSDQTLALQAGVGDYTVSSLIFGDMNERADLVGMVAENLAAAAGSYRVENNVATLMLPVELLVQVADESSGFNLLELTFAGTVTATAILDAPSELTGDYNGNAIVEQADLDLVLLNWGDMLADPAAIGWVNDLPDGAIDQAELDRVLLNWGDAKVAAAGSHTSAPAFGAPPVPEPRALLLALIVSILVFLFDRYILTRETLPSV